MIIDVAHNCRTKVRLPLTFLIPFRSLLKSELPRKKTDSNFKQEPCQRLGSHNDYDRVSYRYWMSSIMRIQERGSRLACLPGCDVEQRDYFGDLENLTILKYTPLLSMEDPSLFQCACDGGARAKLN